MSEKKQKTTEDERGLISSRPEQLSLFEISDDKLKDNYSNTIDLYDQMPMWFHGGFIEREKTKTMEGLPVLSRNFKFRGRDFVLNVIPAAIVDNKTGKTVHYYPSQREELVESAIRKIATKPNRATIIKNEVGVKFTYYEVQQELLKVKHGYSIAEIKSAIEILAKSVLEVKELKGAQVAISSTFFSTVGRETLEEEGKGRVVVTFYPLVTTSVNLQTYRLFNYDNMMKMKMPLSRALHKKLSHIFTQAAEDKIYRVKLLNLVNDNGMRVYTNTAQMIKQVKKSFEELKSHNIIEKYEVNLEKVKNKVVDAMCFLYVTSKFAADVKKANKIINEIKSVDSDEAINPEILRKELQKDIFGLTTTFINNFVGKIKTQKEIDEAINTLREVEIYIRDNEEKIKSNTAITKAALKEGWKFNKKTSGNKIENEVDKRNSYDEKDDNVKVENAAIWAGLKEFIESEFQSDDLLQEEVLPKLKIYSVKENEIILSTNDRFTRDWVADNFEKEGNDKNLAATINKIYPNKKVNIIYAAE